MIRAIADTGKRIRSATASSAGEVAGNRFMSGISSVGIGGTVALIVTHYWTMPEAYHAHQTALVVFGWNTLVYAVGYAWRRWSGESER